MADPGNQLIIDLRRAVLLIRSNRLQPQDYWREGVGVEFLGKSALFHLGVIALVARQVKQLGVEVVPLKKHHKTVSCLAYMPEELGKTEIRRPYPAILMFWKQRGISLEHDEVSGLLKGSGLFRFFVGGKPVNTLPKPVEDVFGNLLFATGSPTPESLTVSLRVGRAKIDPREISVVGWSRLLRCAKRLAAERVHESSSTQLLSAHAGSQKDAHDSGWQFSFATTDLQRVFHSTILDKTKEFTGREFVFDAFDTFVATQSSGYFMVLGVPGIGKSSLVAKLVTDRQCVHHFNVAAQGIRTVRAFWGNLCVQLIKRYKLNHSSLPANALDDSRFFMQCLGEAAQVRKNHPIVIAIDALDESDRTGFPPSANTLYLPSSLPQGVFVLATTRELDDIRLNVNHQERLYLDADSDENQRDIVRYIRNYVKRPAMKHCLAKLGKRQGQFVKTLCEKSQGNFMYLHYVLPAIEKGRFIIGELEELPTGLTEYYQRHWRQMRSENEVDFDKVIEPIICSLAVAKMPVSIAQIQKWTKLDSATILTAIRAWREFFVEERLERIPHYRIYHTSFQDFLEEKVGLRHYVGMIDDYYEALSQRNS